MPLAISVEPPYGAIGFGMSSVSGAILAPRPAAMINAVFIIACHYSFGEFINLNISSSISLSVFADERPSLKGVEDFSLKEIM